MTKLTSTIRLSQTIVDPPPQLPIVAVNWVSSAWQLTPRVRRLKVEKLTIHASQQIVKAHSAQVAVPRL